MEQRTNPRPDAPATPGSDHSPQAPLGDRDPAVTGWQSAGPSADPWRRPVPREAAASADAQPTGVLPQVDDTSTDTTPSPYAAQPRSPYETPAPYATQPTTGDPALIGADGRDNGPAPQTDGPFGTFPPADAPARREESGGRRRGLATTAVIGLMAGLLGGAAGAGIVAAGDDDTSGPVVSSLAAPASSSGSSGASTAADGSIEQVAATVLPSVVSIAVQTSQGSGTGTGVIISSDGNILTNNHVVGGAQDGGTVTVQFQDGSTAEAEIVGTDPVTDLAVIKADRTDLTPAELGSSGDLRVGQAVVAFGSPLGLAGTVTSGIVSALERPVRTDSDDASTNTVIDAVQTDAAINPGNSGGPLVDMQGRVVGINSAIASLGAGAGGQAGSIGLGFSIPIDQAREIADELIEKGSATHALLGVSVGGQQQDDPTQTGAPVADITEGGAAAQAGLQAGDVVTEIDGRVIGDADALVAAVRSHRPGDEVSIVVERGGEEQTLTATLGSDAS